MPSPDVRSDEQGSPQRKRGVVHQEEEGHARAPACAARSRSENTQNSVKEKFQSVETWVAKTAETT